VGVLAVDLDHPVWAGWSTALWRPWYAAAWAEAATLAHLPDLDERLRSAAPAARDNPVATALVQRAAAIATGDLERVAALATTLDGLGATYQRDRSRRLSS